MSFYKTSKGHSFSTAEWLDLHYEAARPEYEAMINKIGIKQGWHVLDAGAGNGRFMDLIDNLVGLKGQITALDLAPENVRVIEEKILASKFKSKVTAHAGDVIKLPFQDNLFDAVWCAAVTQYLTKEHLRKTILEFKRVVKPGGIIAIKEYDGISSYYYPLPDLTLLWRSIDHMDAYDKQKWLVHPIEMHGFLKKAGLRDVTQETILVERRFPLRPVEKNYIESLINAGEVSWARFESLSKKDQLKWDRLLSPKSSEYILKKHNFYWREGHILALGYV